MTRREYFFIILILGSLCTISPFSIDMYLPGFPAIAKDLSTNISQVQLSLTSYLVGIAVGQLLYGPLLDRYGRKRPLYAGLAVYVVASVACALTTSAEGLIAMRFLQAIGGCAGMVAAQALVRDLFPVNKTAQAFSLLTLVVAVSPMIAPTIGGYVTMAFGWHAIFIILAAITLLIIASIYFVLPRGKHADKTISLKPVAVLGNFLSVLKQPQFLIYTLAGGIAMAAPFAYIAGSADVFMNQYHVREHQYGWIFALLAGAMIGTTQLNHFLLKKFSSEQIVKTTLIYQSAVGVFMVIGTALNWFDMIALIAVMFVFLTGQGLTGPNASALSLAPFTRHAGSASALLGAYRMGVGGLVSAIISVVHANTALPMVAGMAGCSLCGLFILFGGKVAIKHRARQAEVEEEPSVLL